MSRTAMLIKPSLAEVQAQALRIELPEHEAEKFFNYYSANGWKVGRVPMTSWTHALAGWKLRWQERNGSRFAAVDRLIYQKELDRILERMRVIRASYSENQSWSQKDRNRFAELKIRRDAVKKLLGVIE